MNGTENFTLLDLFNYHHKYQYTVKQMKEENLQNHHFLLTINTFLKLHLSNYGYKQESAEQKRSVRVQVAWGIAKSNSSFLSTLQTSQVHPILKQQKPLSLLN